MNNKHYYLYLFICLYFLSLLLYSCEIKKNNGTTSKDIQIDAGDDKNVMVYEKVEFTGTAYSENSFIEKYEWDFNGDGIIDKESNYALSYSYKYNEAGIYNALFRVTDEYGNTAEDFCEIKVGYPKPKAGDNIWSNGVPVINDNFSYNYLPSIFLYNNIYYMIYFEDNGDKKYSRSNDGFNWETVDEESFPVILPDEAEDSTDIEIKYIDNQFVLVFAKEGNIYMGKSENGITWSGTYLNNSIMNGFKSPTYVKTSTNEIIWAIKSSPPNQNKVFYKIIEGSDPQMIDLNPSQTIQNCRVIFDGKTYFMWYTYNTVTEQKSNILPVYSEFYNFTNYTACSNVIATFGNYYQDGITCCSIIFDYQTYRFLLFSKGLTNPSQYKIGICTCNHFQSMPGYNEY